MATMQNLPTAGPSVRRVTRVTEADLRALAAVLIDCVNGGASVSFMLPLGQDKALAYWRQVADEVTRGARVLFVAADEVGVAGTVQLALEMPENQPHRADVAKMLVHRRVRRQGVGAALLRAAERHAVASGRTLLVLDTADATAERLYSRLGWQRVGEVPGYALLPGGTPCKTTFFYRDLRAHLITKEDPI
jgi:GNAT superfamily N-acetyltransferase